MEQEIIEYRRQSFKGKLLLSKKFSKYYLNRFRPLTIKENFDVESSRNMYRSFTLLGALGMGLASLKFRKMRISQMANHEAPRDPNMLGNVLNDIFMGVFGYLGAHLITCDYIYKHRQYVIERMHFERENGFQRDTFDLGAVVQAENEGKEVENQFMEEYPFAEFVSKSDAVLQAERLRSPE